MDSSAAPLVGFGIAYFLFIAVLSLISLGLFVFWLVELIDCIKNEPNEGNDKLVWILVIVLLHALGALLYLIIRKPQRKERYGV